MGSRVSIGDGVTTHHLVLPQLPWRRSRSNSTNAPTRSLARRLASRAPVLQLAVFTPNARRAAVFPLAMRAGVAGRAAAFHPAMRAGVAVRAVPFKLAMRAGVAGRAGAFHLAMRAGVAACAHAFPLAVRTRVAPHAVVFPLPVQAPLASSHRLARARAAGARARKSVVASEQTSVVAFPKRSDV